MLHIIANPASSSGSGRQRIQKLLVLLEHSGIEAVLHMTTHPGHAGEIAAGLSLTEKDRLVIVGGDGSLNDLMNGLTLPYRTPITLFPSGSGNDFARGMKLSREPEDLISVLKGSATSQQIDLGSVTSAGTGITRQEHRFAVSCGFGMDAAICSALEAGMLKKLCNHLHIGKLSYLVTGVRVLLGTGKKKRALMKLSYVEEDGASPVELTLDGTAFVAIHNLPYEGGGFPFCPDASACDGYLNVCAVRVSNRLLMIPILLANLAGAKHGLFRRNVKLFRCRSITVTSDRPLPLHTDGEVIPDQLSFTAHAMKGVVSFLPAERNS